METKFAQLNFSGFERLLNFLKPCIFSEQHSVCQTTSMLLDLENNFVQKLLVTNNYQLVSGDILGTPQIRLPWS